MKDANRRTGRRDSDVRKTKTNLVFIQISIFIIKKASTETPDFIFDYSDSDSLNSELAEWYTYSEEPEFVWNAKAFRNTLFKENCKTKFSFNFFYSYDNLALFF